MSKTNTILVCIIIALISGIVGFIIGINVKNSYETNSILKKTSETDFVGTYKTNTWNGKEAVIALKNDKTMISPNGSGTWELKEGKIYIEYEIQIPSSIDNGKVDYKTVQKKEEVTIVENGLMLSGHFFELVK